MKRFLVVAFVVLSISATLLGGAPALGANDRTDIAALSGIVVSDRPDRSQARSIEADVLSGDVYVFWDGSPTPRRVSYYINDPEQGGEPFSIAAATPFDLVGQDSSLALPWHTESLGDGRHTLTAVLFANNGRNSEIVRHAEIVVRNGDTPPDPEPTPTPTPTEEPTPAPSPDPDGRLGLHVTIDELKEWRQRAVDGPYKTKGDVSENSPGDWNSVVERKGEFIADPDRYRFPGMKVFAGVGSTGCVSQADDTNAVDAYLEGAEALNAAAFYALIKEDRAVARAVADEIVAQVNYQDTRFGDRSRYCLDSGPYGDQAPVFGVSDWLTSFVYARDYLMIFDPSLFSGTQKTEFDAWATGFARWVNARNDVKLNAMFHDRPGGDYTPNSVGNSIPNFAYNGLWDNGPIPHTTAVRYNNRNARVMRIVGIVGVLTDDQTLVASAKKFWKEVLMFAYFPQGGISDFERWESDDPGKGWKYASEILSPMVMTADAIARSTGDTELFDFATTQGVNGTQGEHNHGGPKTMKRAVEDVYRYVTGEYTYTADGKRIRAGKRLHDVALVPANRYYRTNYIRDRYMRKVAVGAEPYPTKPLEGKFNVEGGDCGTLPGVLFMFGQMEQVWPYPD